MRYIHIPDIIRPFGLLLSFLLFSASLYGQDDLRLSAFEPPVYNFPTDVQIASAATVAGTTLVVWGTTTPGPDSAIGALVMQRIVGGTAVGLPEIVHTSQARPFGVVSVVGLDDKFVVLWNDRRIGAPGIYLRRVGMDGALLGNEELMVPGGRLNHDTTVYLERTLRGFRIVWRDTTGVRPVLPNNSYYYGQDLDPAGGLLSRVTRMVQINFDDTLEYSNFPGMRIVRRADGSGLLYHQDGTVDSRTVPVTRLLRPFYLDPDTSVIVMEGIASGDRRVAFYHSLFDTTAYRSVALPTKGITPFRYAGALGRDSAGRVVIIFGYSGLLENIGGAAYVGPILQRGVITDADTLEEIQVFDTAFGGESFYSASYFKTVALTKEITIAGDENSSILMAVYHNEKHERDGNWYQQDQVDQWSFNEHADSLKNLGVFPNNIRIRHHLVLGYLKTGTSQVAVYYGSSFVTLMADLVPKTPQVRRERPIIIDRGGKLLVAWDRIVPVPTYESVRIDSFDSAGIVPLRPFLPDPAGTWHTYSGPREWWSTLTSTFGEGNGAALVFASSVGGIKDQYGWGQVTWFAAHLLVDTGWVRVVYQTFVWVQHDLLRVLYDPNTNYLTFAGPKKVLYSMDLDGRIRWSKSRDGMPPRFDPIWLIGSDSSNYFLTNHDSIYQVQKGVTSFAHLFPKGEAKSVRYYHLLGDGLLRIAPADSLLPNGTLRDSTINLEILGLEGVRRGNYTMRLPSAEYRIAFAERPSDGSIFFLFGADDGLHMTVLDKNLQPRVVDLLLAQRTSPIHNPSIVLRGDTLYAVWQDKRDGTDAIFAHRWVLKGVLPDQAPDIKVPPGAPGIAIGTIRPNPARDYAQMRVELSEASSLQIDMVDALGRVVQHEDRGSYAVGTWDIGINISDLHPGAYFIRLHTSHGETTARIVVTH